MYAIRSYYEGKELALKVAKLVKADHIRIDVFYYNNQAIINEIITHPVIKATISPRNNFV